MGNKQSFCYGVLGETLELLIYQILFPVIIISGICGNILSSVVWCTGEKSKKSKCSIYFRFLAIIDLAVIFLPGALTYLAVSLKINLMDLSKIFCMTYMFSGSFLMQVSAWITVALTIERTLCTVFPFKFSSGRSPRRTLVVLTTTVVLSLLLNIPTTMTYRFDEIENVTRCFVAEDEVSNIFIQIRTVSYTFLTSLVPLAIIILGNMLMIAKIAQSRFRDNAHEAMKRKVTKLAVSIGIVFVLSSLPWALFLLVNQSWVKTNMKIVANIYCVSMAPVYLNNALNPWLYCCFGKGFRQDLGQMAARVTHCCSWKQDDVKLPANNGAAIKSVSKTIDSRQMLKTASTALILGKKN